MRLLRKSRDALLRTPNAILIGIGVAVVAIAGFLLVEALRGDGDQDEPPTQLAIAGSSWIEGQPSLATYPGFLAVAVRAEALGRERLDAREDLLAEIERRRRLAEKRARARQRAERRRARREARREYQEALREAARERRRQERLIRERRQEIRERIERLRERNAIEPGEECELEEVQQYFDCEKGYPF